MKDQQRVGILVRHKNEKKGIKIGVRVLTLVGFHFENSLSTKKENPL